MRYNTINLVYGLGQVGAPCDTINGPDNDAKTVKSWPIEEEAKAREELAKKECSYWIEKTFAGFTVIMAEEWALEFCEMDEDGEFVDGSDLESAKVAPGYEFPSKEN